MSGSLMFHVDFLGYLAGGFLIAMATAKMQLWMRCFNIAGNATFIIYGYMAGVWPVFVLNAITLTMHARRLSQLNRSGVRD